MVWVRFEFIFSKIVKHNLKKKHVLRLKNITYDKTLNILYMIFFDYIDFNATYEYTIDW